MPKYKIPKSPGEMFIHISRAGTPLVWNGKTSQGSIKIPCRDQSHVEEIVEKIKNLADKGGGELWV